MRWMLPLLLLAIVAAFIVSSALREQSMDVDGHLYGRWTRVPTEHPIDPVAGAVISDDRNTSRATTDATGHFHLQTSHTARDEFVVLRVRSGDVVKCQRVHGYPHLRMDLIFSTLPPCSAEAAAAPPSR
jgi:hypothetical protein